MRPVVAAILLQFADPSTRPGDGLSPQLGVWDIARRAPEGDAQALPGIASS
jgi:hypothetical protein